MAVKAEQKELDDWRSKEEINDKDTKPEDVKWSDLDFKANLVTKYVHSQVILAHSLYSQQKKTETALAALESSRVDTTSGGDASKSSFPSPLGLQQHQPPRERETQ